MQQEDVWLQHLPIRLKSSFPNNKTSLLDYAARSVSLGQHDCLDKQIQPLNLRINTIKDVIANRLFSDSILSWVIAKINANCKNTLAFSFLEEFQGNSWNEALVHRFQEKFLNHQPSTLIIFLNVGRYSEKSGNSIKYTTLIEEYYDRRQKRYTACYYSLLVYSFKNSKCFYCNSLGWSKPTFIDSYKKELILPLRNEAALIDIIECHYNDTNIRSLQVQKHKCTQGKCASYFPLQICGNICGASVVVCGCLGSYDYELFERFCTFQGLRQSADLSSIKYLKNISYYGTFLRVMLMKWFIENNVDIFGIVGEKCKEWSTQTKLHNTTPTKRKEMEIVLHCAAREFYLHQGINKQTKK